MGREKKIIGRLGEEAALQFLGREGYKIIETNFRTSFGELDAIAEHKDFIVFVEIKTRLTSSLGPPCLSVTKSKARHLVKNALCFLKIRGCVESYWRIDVVSVKLNVNHEVEHIEIIENAIEDGYY